MMTGDVGDGIVAARQAIMDNEVAQAGVSLRGAEVHEAARICGAASAGEILTSREFIELVDLGAHHRALQSLSLKGIADAVEVAPVAWT